MKTGNTECTNCNHAYLNCYQTCPNSPARNDSVALTLIQTSDLGERNNGFGECNNGHKREMQIRAEVAREIFEEIEKICDAHLYWNNCSIIQRDDIAELKKKYTEGENERNNM